MFVTLLCVNYAKSLRTNYGAKLVKILDLCKCLYNFYIKTPLLFAFYSPRSPLFYLVSPLAFLFPSIYLPSVCIGTSSEPHRNFIGTSSELHRNLTVVLPYQNRIILISFSILLGQKKSARIANTLNSQLLTLNSKIGIPS